MMQSRIGEKKRTQDADKFLSADIPLPTDMEPFAVVKFIMDDTVDFLPSVWLKGQTAAYWPTKNVSRFRREQCQPDPQSSAWKLYAIEVYEFAESEQSARELRLQYEKGSEVENSEKLIPKMSQKRKLVVVKEEKFDDDEPRRKLAAIAENDAEVDHIPYSQLASDSVTTPNSPCPHTAIEEASNVTVNTHVEVSEVTTNSPCANVAIESSARSDFDDTLPTITSPSCLIGSEEVAAAPSSCPMDNSNGNHSCHCPHVEMWFRRIFACMERMEASFTAQLKASLIKSEDFHHVFSDCPLPLESLSSLRDFNQRLDTDSVFRSFMVERLYQLGGYGAQKCCRTMMKVLVAPSLAASMNFRGVNRSGNPRKMAFDEFTHVLSVIATAVRKRFPDTSNRDVEVFVAEWLKHTPRRRSLGGDD